MEKATRTSIAAIVKEQGKTRRWAVAIGCGPGQDPEGATRPQGGRVRRGGWNQPNNTFTKRDEPGWVSGGFQAGIQKRLCIVRFGIVKTVANRPQDG